MNPADLDTYLHQHIPLSRHMGLRVLAAEPAQLRLHLPLAPNVNPHGTLFGGALSATGLVCGWMLLHAALVRAGLQARLVGQRSETDFLAPATADCVAESLCAPEALAGFVAALTERGRARLNLETVIRLDAVDVVRHRGTYVAHLESKVR